MHEHLEESQIVARGSIEPAAAHEKFGILRYPEFDRLECSIGLARVHAHEAIPLTGTDDEAGVAHAERGKDVVAQIGIELLAAYLFDRLADEIDVDAVFPSLARIEHKRELQRGVLAGDDAGQFSLFRVLRDIRVPDVVAKTRRVGQQVPERDGPFGWT